MLPRTLTVFESIPSGSLFSAFLDNTVEGDESFTLHLNSSDPQVEVGNNTLTVVIYSEEGRYIHT